MSRKVIKTGTEYTDIQYYYTEITNQNADKWEAIKELMKIMNISKEQIIAIGDNINDKLMIENAGLGIIMGDSALSIQNMKNLVTKNNNSNGVAYAINNYILNDK
jgi:hydroxymethylpyrimidine pyrophosphatase-like HAD family hydrolase